LIEVFSLYCPLLYLIEENIPIFDGVYLDSFFKRQGFVFGFWLVLWS